MPTDTMPSGYGLPVPRPDAAETEIEDRIRGWVRHEMDERGINQTALAKRIGMHQGHLSHVLKGDRGVGLVLAVRIHRALAIPYVRLLEEDPPDKQRKPPIPHAAPAAAQPRGRKAGGD